MQKQLQEELSDAFPFLRRGLSVERQKALWGFVRDLYGAFGLDVGDGWYQLIRDMCAEITAAYEMEGAPVDLVVDQVKEKFGMLCFYYHHEAQNIAVSGSDSLSDSSGPRFRSSLPELHQKVAQIVGKYEEKSAHACEVCGEEGRLREDLGWMLTLCDDHYHIFFDKTQHFRCQQPAG